MLVLLDECVPRRIRRALPVHEVRTVAEMGWSGKKNGELLALMVAAGFQVLLTVDRNLRYQQNLANAGIALIVMVAGSNRVPDLLPLMPEVLTVLDVIQPGEVVEVAASGSPPTGGP
jgi:hypothetical protein